MAKDRGVPGNSMQESVLLEKEIHDVGLAVLRLGNAIRLLHESGFTIKQMKFVNKDGLGREFLVVVTASTTDGELIAFSGGGDLKASLLRVQTQLNSNSLKWKEDEYATRNG